MYDIDEHFYNNSSNHILKILEKLGSNFIQFWIIILKEHAAKYLSRYKSEWCL